VCNIWRCREGNWIKVMGRKVIRVLINDGGIRTRWHYQDEGE